MTQLATWFRRSFASIESLAARRDIAGLVGRVRNADSREKIREAHFIKELGDPAAVQPLLEVLDEVEQLGTAWNTGTELGNPISAVVETIGTLDMARRPACMALGVRYRYRMAATIWWYHRSESTAVCDDCNARLKAGQGYLRPGKYLACRECTDRFLAQADWPEALSNLRRAFGPNVDDLARVANNWSSHAAASRRE